MLSSAVPTTARLFFKQQQPSGQAWPEIPAGGFRSEADLAKLPGVHVIDAKDAVPGPTPEVYAFSRETVQRNLYRVPVP